jgi:ABC-type bacteriocin/lantibiotic exporter with double-glycine peptidase domain
MWLVGMFALVGVRLFLLHRKNCVSEGWLYRVSARITAWFLHRLRRLSPRVFHTAAGEREVESAYEATQMLQVNGGVFFQAVQAVLQLLVFLPVLFYISWPLALFLFVVVVPLVAVLQRKLHRLGPAEETLLRARSDFRGDLSLSRRLFRQWSGHDERREISNGLLNSVRRLRDDGLSAALQKSGLSLLTESVSVLAMVLVLAFCAVLMGRGLMDGSGLVLFSSAVLLCYKPVKECARVMPQFRAAVSALHVLESFERLETVAPKTQDDCACVSVCNGNFRYEGAPSPVFAGLNLCWSREKPVLVRGKNGVGKSTLLRLLAGLELWNEEAGDCSASRGLRDVFFVAQDLELPPRSMLVRRLDCLEPDSVEKKAVFAFIEASGAAGLLEKQGLSGGERARVALVWALASGAKTVLLDEPFASVALSDREQLLSAYLSAASSLNKWTIIVSHDVLSSDFEVKFNVVHF